MYVRRHVSQSATGWSGHITKSNDLSRMNTNTMRASSFSKHERVKPGDEIVRWKVWTLVDNSRPTRALLHLLRRIALSTFAGTFPPRLLCLASLLAELLELFERHDLRPEESGETPTAFVAVRAKDRDIGGHVDVVGFPTVRVKKPRCPPVA